MSRRGKVTDWLLTAVVVLVLGCLLIALLLPAVQSARESAQRPENVMYSSLPATAAGQGQGPGLGGDKFQHLPENEFIAVADPGQGVRLDLGFRVLVNQFNEYSHVIEFIDRGFSDFGLCVLPPGLVE